MGWFSVCKVNDIKPDFPFSAQAGNNRVGIYLVEGEYLRWKIFVLMPMHY